ncbi:2-phospho-L-lactate guanylyltransferase [Marinomonas pollencensis]|uniref:3-phospho-D-glycerate guanylyltransferase n=1 Tax=Marinomonas pollencensis TaxID=491954 RepID=A0A3E0DNE3_9GAMM|nr:2-phospho-L-lactate guanylyltransferase [Marinomonas pollencensis]REG84269.1 2-phospho-L-lactate guanylyltransferase [Marinomonas pollencensis]
MTHLCIVIPMKSPSCAKQRLAGCLSASERQQLAVSLYANTLAFFQQHFPQHQVVVISQSCVVLSLAKSYGAHGLREEGKEGLNEALWQACQWVKKAGFTHQVIVPSDISLLDKQEFDLLFAVATQQQVVIAQAKDGGTNALVSSPPDAIGFHYGLHSAAQHAQAAKRQGLSFCQLRLPHLAQDIDQGEDLDRAITQQAEHFLPWCETTRKWPVKERQYA